MSTKKRTKKKQRPRADIGFRPPVTYSELCSFLISDHKRNAVHIIEQIAERFGINVEIHP